jgi:hypothetical protein
MSGTRAGFYGVYRVLGYNPASKGRILPGCRWSEEWNQEAQFFYDLERDERFDDLRDRLIIDWGRATRSWVQNSTNKVLLQIQEPGRRLPPFDDYLEFSLTYVQLKDLFANEEAHREWRARLSAVGGIYLILAEGSGDLYVGSASGEGGIWGRWREYAKSGHAGNTLLGSLGLVATPAGAIRYQLLHRAASAVVTGEQYHAAAAVLIVHSFSEERVGWPDYQSFTRLFRVEAVNGAVQFLGRASSIPRFGVWVVGDCSFLRS